MMRKRLYERSEERQEKFCLSSNNFYDSASSSPYKLLAAAVIEQAATDCSAYEPDDPEAQRMKSDIRRYLTHYSLMEFINSDWIELLLSWQSEITTERVREELIKRMDK